MIEYQMVRNQREWTRNHRRTIPSAAVSGNPLGLRQRPQEGSAFLSAPAHVTANHLIINALRNNPRLVFERGLYGNSLWDRELAITEGDTLASLGMTGKALRELRL